MGGVNRFEPFGAASFLTLVCPYRQTCWDRLVSFLWGKAIMNGILACIVTFARYLQVKKIGPNAK